MPPIACTWIPRFASINIEVNISRPCLTYFAKPHGPRLFPGYSFGGKARASFFSRARRHECGKRASFPKSSATHGNFERSRTAASSSNNTERGKTVFLTERDTFVHGAP